MNARRVTLAISVALVLLVGAVVPAAAVTPKRPLPPFEKADLARIFDPKVRKFGLHTTRATLQSLETYDSDPKGTHLAIYLEPIKDGHTDEQYVESFTQVAKVFLPMIYKRWKGLTSFDVCLEPNPGEDARAEPPPVTQLIVTRRSFDEVSWKRVKLVDLLVVSNEHEDRATERDFTAYFATRLDQEPTLTAARAEAANG